MLIVDTGNAVMSRRGMMLVMKRRCGTGFLCAAFGVGLLAATICPPQLMLVLVAAALVVVGCSRARS